MKTEQSLKVRLRLQIVITLPPPHAFAHRFVSSISGDTVMPDHWLGLWMNKTCATSLQIRHEKSHAVKHHWWVNPRKHDNYFRQHDGRRERTSRVVLPAAAFISAERSCCTSSRRRDHHFFTQGSNLNPVSRMRKRIQSR
jgi:hypothetical protein